MLLLLAVPVGLSALASSAGVLRLPHELMLIDVRMPVIFRLHMISAGLALVLMPIAIARHGRSMHKLVGRSAALLGVLGGVTALPVALASEASLLARAGFFAQGVVWIALLVLAVMAIRAGRCVPHRWLMLMATAVASGAIWLRLATWTAITTGAPFAAVYGVAAWLAWMLPAGIVALIGTRYGFQFTPFTFPEVARERDYPGSFRSQSLPGARNSLSP